MNFLSQLAQSGNSSLYQDPSVYGNGTQISQEGAVAIAGAIFGVSLLIGIIAYVVGAFLLSRIFKKAGVEAWKAWVPIYNTWVLLELGDQKGYWAILTLIPIVNIIAVIFVIIAEYNIGLKLQKEGWFVLLAIFLPIVWLIWLAFDKSTWQGVPVLATPTGSPQPPVPPAAPMQTPPQSPTPPQQPPQNPPTFQ